MSREVDDMAKEFLALNSQFARLEKLVGQISDKQATLVNKMAAKPENRDENHEDLKVLGVTPIESFFLVSNLMIMGLDMNPLWLKSAPMIWSPSILMLKALKVEWKTLKL